MDAMPPSWDATATLEQKIDHALLDILGPNNTMKPSSGTTTTPTVSENDFSAIDKVSIVFDGLLLVIQSMYDAFQCPSSDSPIVPPPTSIFKGPRNLGELSPSATPTTTSCQRPSTPSSNPMSLQSSSPLALPSKPVSSSSSTNCRLNTSHPFRDRGLPLQQQNQQKGRQH